MLRIKAKVNSRIFLLRSIGRSLLPCNKYCVRTLFKRLSYPNGRNIAKTPVRRSFRCKSNEGQSNKKSSVSSMPSFKGEDVTHLKCRSIECKHRLTPKMNLHSWWFTAGKILHSYTLSVYRSWAQVDTGVHFTLKYKRDKESEGASKYQR